jgi:hypothetical protein
MTKHILHKELAPCVPVQVSDDINVSNIAENLLSMGLSIIPVKMPGKEPTIPSWKQYQTRLPGIGELTYAGSIALVCGKVSGNIEVLDIDSKNDPTITDRLFQRFKESDVVLPDNLLIQRTISGGQHLIYRCDEPATTVLAKNADGEVTIETRGEGAYVVISPTKSYEVISGSFDEIPTITTELRHSIFEAARSLNEKFKTKNEPKKSDSIRGLSPGDDYNQRGKVEDLLQKHGWSFVQQTSNGSKLYRRPGKSEGCSGSYKPDINCFYCFTSSTVLEAGTGYSPFALLTFLEHGGDFNRCAGALLEAGFGSPPLNAKTQSDYTR